MWPAYFDPIVPTLLPAFDAAIHSGLVWTAVVASIGMAAITCLVVREAIRSHGRSGQIPRETARRNCDAVPTARAA